ncbi:putative lyr family protein [Diaporthe ampelina]|uniref:Putative lyr family protein n=1 Tax=Diaporthe ampelina TaxID=1214573 RepID=A0A0G2FBA4_9PEZI|nr:putative lyr family protein [Diaporthe ampelina]
MPRDAHLLTPHNQELLRLVRSGKLYKKRPLPEEDDADADGIPGDKQEKKDSAVSEGYSFRVKKWVRLERSAEDAGINHLAPRHKGTITRPSNQLGTQVIGPMVTKATVKRLDAAGNPYTQEDGSTEVKPESVGPDGVKIESEDASRGGGDAEMNESSALDDDDGDEGSGDDDEGDGDESGTPAAEGEDMEMKDAPAYQPLDSVADAPPATTLAETAQPATNLVPPPLVTDPVQLEGSPLKNVTLRSPTDPAPHLSPIAATVVSSADTGLSEVPVAQVSVEEVIGNLGTNDVKEESRGAENVVAETDGAADAVAENTGATDVGAETAGVEDAGAKHIVGADDARAVTEDGSFDILGSLSTSLNQQAEDDAPPPSLPAGPADSAASEPAQPAQPDKPAQPSQADEAGLTSQTGETVMPDRTGQTGETSETTEIVQASQASEIKEGAETQTQELP